MNILVLGSEGFIGGHCIDHFAHSGEAVFGIDIHEQPSKQYNYLKVSRLSPEFNELFEKQSFDVVINAAGSGNVPYSMTHPLSDFESNCLDTIRVLDVLRKHQPVCKYVHISSAAVYGNPARLPVKEEDDLMPISPYGWHKLISEQLCREYASVYHLRTAIVRPFSVYGEGLKKQLLWDIYQKIQAAQGTIELHGTGKESRDFVHVSDLVEAIECIVQNGIMQSEVYNVASGVETSIETAVNTFFEALHKEPLYRFNGIVREGDPVNWRADISKLCSIGYRPTTQLGQGLKKVAEWARSLS